MLFNLVPFGLYFGFLLAALLAGGRLFNGQWLFLLRSFFPNWKFFHALGWVPRLYWRTDAVISLPHVEPQWSDWSLLLPRYQRRLSHLIFNAEVNLALSEQNLVEHLSSDIAESVENERVDAFVTYRMVEKMVRQKLSGALREGSRFQFCLCLHRLGKPVDLDRDRVLLSPDLRL